MKFKSWVLLFTVMGLIQSCHPSPDLSARALPHMDLEASSQELAPVVEAQKSDESSPLTDEQKKLEIIIETGKRNLQWFSLIAKNQSAGRPPLSISKPSTKGIPIEEAQRYNGVIIIAEFDQVVLETPAAMKSVLIDKAPLTNTAPLVMADYLDWARKYDRQYQQALRWKMYQAYLPDMASLRRYDIRGYYFLKQRTNLQTELENWATLSAADQKNLRAWIEMECFNGSGNASACAASFDEAVAQKSLWAYHQKKAEDSAIVYSQFFDIWDTRAEAVWNSKNPGTFILPFKTPQNSKVKEALRKNIQDEWRWNGWQLELQFTANAAVHVNFEAGAVPNVNGTGGDTITMDANTPLEEETTKYALRHEFGHVLGFPDCYLEFYDDVEKVMISYQIDVTDIMCSRAGKFKQRHFDDLKKAYFQNP